jgi:hypothetical protein
VAKRWTWVAWSMLAIYAASLACRTVLAVLNGSITGNSTYALYLPAFTAFMVVGALGRVSKVGSSREMLPAWDEEI